MKKLLFFLLLLPLNALAGDAILTWDPVINAVTYHVERAIGACGATGLNFVQIGTTAHPTVTYTDKGLEEGKDVCYRVAASNPAAKSGYSNLAGKQVAWTPPAVPANLLVK